VRLSSWVASFLRHTEDETPGKNVFPSFCRTKVTGTELEKKIAEACSNKPWGASSTLQSEIAQATYN